MLLCIPVSVHLKVSSNCCSIPKADSCVTAHFPAQKAVTKSVQLKATGTGVRCNYEHVPPPWVGDQNSLLCTPPGFSSHSPQPRKVPHWSFRLAAPTELFKREHSPLQSVPANHESGDKTAIASHLLPGNPWPNPTHSRKSCRRA